MANQAPVAWVTGGTGGIGTAICRSLADAGYLVVAGYHNPDKPSKPTAITISHYRVLICPTITPVSKAPAKSMKNMGRSACWSTAQALPAMAP